MIQIGMWGAAALSVVNLAVLVLVLKRLASMQKDNTQQWGKDELGALRDEVSRSDREIRNEIRASQETTANTLVKTVGELGETQARQLKSGTEAINALTQSNVRRLEEVKTTVDKRLQAMQTSNEEKSEKMYKTVTNQLQSTADTLVKTVGELGNSQDSQLDNVRKTVHEQLDVMRTSNEAKSEQMHKTVTNQLQATADTLVKTVGELGNSQDSQLESVRKTVNERLEAMQTSNEKKLDQMRNTVDEKLQSTLEKRLSDSFSFVDKRLEEVRSGLKEMQDLATGVGDLKRVLTNVKSRGTWAEYQLGTILDEVLTPNQYDSNVRITENSHERVEYAVRLPGRDDEPNSCVWLPIDSKFPLADYDKVVDAAKGGERDAVQKTTQAFLATVRNEAKKIGLKYINPPETTDFAIMFLPTEGLYAEVLRSPGQVTELLQRFRIVVAGPTTLAAILSSLRLGFRTLAIEKRSSEIGKLLGAVKGELVKFGAVIDTLKKQLESASNTVDKTQTRTRVMARHLREVEELPSEETTALLELSATEHGVNGNIADD